MGFGSLLSVLQEARLSGLGRVGFIDIELDKGLSKSYFALIECICPQQSMHSILPAF